MTKSKTKLPKEIAEALDVLLPHFTTTEIVEHTLDMRVSLSYSTHFAAFNVLRHEHLGDETFFNRLISALANGYDPEYTPHDKLRKYYNDAEIHKGVGMYRYRTNKGIREGVLRTLEILDIDVEGLNVAKDGKEATSNR